MVIRLANAFAPAAIAYVISISPAAAITADVARTCDALVAKRFPPRVPGNPAAGSAKGSAADQNVFFKRCVANGGKVDDGGGGGSETPKGSDRVRGGGS
jgi:hypothetical protein